MSDRDKTQLSEETDIHAPRGIRTRNHRKRAPVDPSFRPRDHIVYQVGGKGAHLNKGHC